VDRRGQQINYDYFFFRHTPSLLSPLKLSIFPLRSLGVKEKNRQDNNQEEFLRGTLDMLILKTLTRGALHGYNIAERIEQGADGVLLVEEGALYQALHRLELRGLLDSEWGVSENNRRAKFYRLTAEGRAHLERTARRWERVSEAVSRIMRIA
jgi:PadR family transcriptional regulator